MKNRRTVVVAFMLIAVLLLGVGYAALTDNLTLTGEATANTTASQATWETDIYFANAKISATTGNSSAADKIAVGTSNNDSVHFEVFSLAKKGETVTFTVDIINDGVTGYDANITMDNGYPTNTNAEYFKVTYDYGNAVVPVGGSLTVTITVELLKNPAENTVASFTANLTATSAEPAQNN